MEKTYRLEFNEKQQNFHLDNYTHEEGTHGWFTVFEHCTDVEFKVYEAFVNRVPNKKLTKEYLLKCAIEIKGFTNNLLEYGLQIGKVTQKNNKITEMKRFILVEVPTEATDIFINNVGCLRYSHNRGRESTAIEPIQIGYYLEKDKHRIVGDSITENKRIIVIEMDEF